MIRVFFTTHVGLLIEFAGVLGIIALVIVVAAGVIARFDRVPFEDAIYFAFITAFTVGFGDVAPQSRGARAVSVILAFLGLILIGIFVAVAAQSLETALQSAAAEL